MPAVNKADLTELQEEALIPKPFSKAKASFEKLASSFAEMLNGYVTQMSPSPQKFHAPVGNINEAFPDARNFMAPEKFEELVNKFERSVRDVMAIRIPHLDE